MYAINPDVGDTEWPMRSTSWHTRIKPLTLTAKIETGYPATCRASRDAQLDELLPCQYGRDRMCDYEHRSDLLGLACPASPEPRAVVGVGQCLT